MSKISDIQLDLNNIKDEVDSSMYYEEQKHKEIKNSAGKEYLFPNFDDPYDFFDKESEDKCDEEIRSYLDKSDDENSTNFSSGFHPYQNQTTFLTHEMLKENHLLSKTSASTSYDNENVSSSQLENSFGSTHKRSGSKFCYYRNSGDCHDASFKGSQTQKGSQYSGYTNDSEPIPFQGAIYMKRFSSQDKKSFQELDSFTLAKDLNAEAFRVPLKSIPNFQTKSHEEGDNFEQMKTLDDNCTSWPFSQSQPINTKHIPNFSLKSLKPSNKIDENSVVNKKRSLIKPSFKPVFKMPKKSNENVTIENTDNINSHNIKFSSIVAPDMNETDQRNKNMDLEGTKYNELIKEYDHSNAVTEKSVFNHQDLDINSQSFAHDVDTSADIENVETKFQAEKDETEVQAEKKQLPINKSTQVQKLSANKSVDINAGKSKVHNKYEKSKEICESADFYQFTFQNKYPYLYRKSKHNENLVHNKLSTDEIGKRRIYRIKIDKKKRTKRNEIKTKKSEWDTPSVAKLNESINSEIIKVEVSSDNENSGSKIDPNNNMFVKENSCDSLTQLTLRGLCENLLNSRGSDDHHLNATVHTKKISNVPSGSKTSTKIYEAPTHNQDENKLCTNKFERKKKMYTISPVSKRKRSSKEKNIVKSKKHVKKPELKKKEKVESVKKHLLGLHELTNFPVWVQCDNCKKWRCLRDTFDPASLPNYWTCSMNSDDAFSACSVSEEKYNQNEHDKSFAFNKFTLGSVVWVTCYGPDWWPAMVDDDPDTETFFWLPETSDVPDYYHVTFFGPETSRAWIKTRSIIPFKSSDIKTKSMQKSKAALKCAIEEAKQALTLSLRERRLRHCFATRYKGNWFETQEMTLDETDD